MARGLAVVFVLAVFVGVPASALGQDGTGPRITATIGGAFGDGRASASLGVGAGYRFTRWLAVDVELGYLPSFDHDGPMGGGRGPGMGMGPMFGPDPIPGYRFHFDSRLVTFMSTASLEVPVATDRLRLFALGGVGAGSYRERLGVSIGIVGVPSYDIHETSLLVAAGGGLEADVWKGLAVGGEVRYFHLFADLRDLGVTRVAARVGWRF